MSESAQGEPAGEQGALFPLLSGESLPREARDTVVPGPTEPPAAARATPSVLTCLDGILLRALDRSPVPHATLAFHFGEYMTKVVTDEGGRFRTESVVPAGIVRAYHVGTQTRAGFGQHRELEPTLFVVPEESSREPTRELELVLCEPVAALDVQVLRNGLPAAGSVNVLLRARGWSEATDDLGRAHLEFGALAPDAEVRLVAHAEPFMSRTAELHSPWPDEVVVLELESTGALRVRALDASGMPLPGRLVSLQGGWSGERTDAEGVALLEPVLAGPVTVVTAGSEPGTAVVPAGGVAELELVVSSSVRLVSGTVVDEQGNGIARVGLVVRSGYTSQTLVTQQDGSFDIRWTPDTFVDLVHVEIGQAADEDRYEPENITVSVGTTGLVLRRVASKELVELDLMLIDAHTRQPLEDGRVIVLRERFPDSCEASPTRDGLVVCSFKPFDDVLVHVRAPGYRDRSFPWRDFEREVHGNGLVTLALEPGFEQTFVLKDCDSGEPLVGARILAEREGALELLALTDFAGSAHLELERWPSILHAVADGYESDSLSCTDYLDYVDFCLYRQE